MSSARGAQERRASMRLAPLCNTLARRPGTGQPAFCPDEDKHHRESVRQQWKRHPFDGNPCNKHSPPQIGAMVSRACSTILVNSIHISALPSSRFWKAVRNPDQSGITCVPPHRIDAVPRRHPQEREKGWSRSAAARTAEMARILRRIKERPDSPQGQELACFPMSCRIP